MMLLDLFVRVLVIGSLAYITKRIIKTPKKEILENIKIFFGI